MERKREEQALWRRLEGFEFDVAGAQLSFVQRLARENGWTRRFAERAVREYRRFVFLAKTAGHPVTPSDEVDQVWHMHLCYTRSYWNDLCGAVLGQPLHHGPTRGGSGERAKFDDWYRRTLASYTRRWGPPPADLWPSPNQRFAMRRWRRVDVGRNVLVPRTPLLTAAAMLLCSLALSCSKAGGKYSFATVLMLCGVVFFIICVVTLLREHGRGGGQRGGSDACGGASRHDYDADDGYGDGDGDGGCGGGCGD